MEPVRSRQNRRVVAANRLRRARERHQTGRTLIEGPHLLHEALRAGAAIVEVFCLPEDDDTTMVCSRHGLDVTPVTPAVLEALADTTTPRGPVAVIRIPEPVGPGGADDMIYAELSDPGNAGTVLRTAAAFHMGVVIPTGCVDPWSPKTIRAGAGAHFRTWIARELPEGAARLAAVPRGGALPERLADLLDPSRSWALMIGSEAHGLDEAAIAGADATVSIPMPGGTESLNAAAATAILAYELDRWRRQVSLTSPLRTADGPAVPGLDERPDEGD